jgi:hypothetical protein
MQCPSIWFKLWFTMSNKPQIFHLWHHFNSLLWKYEHMSLNVHWSLWSKKILLWISATLWSERSQNWTDVDSSTPSDVYGVLPNTVRAIGKEKDEAWQHLTSARCHACPHVNLVLLPRRRALKIAKPRAPPGDGRSSVLLLQWCGAQRRHGQGRDMISLRMPTKPDVNIFLVALVIS